MKISFIIAYYNKPVQMLRQCIDSIMALDLNDDEREIIVVDDGSDTPAHDAVDGYGRHVICIRQKNQGPSVSRNNAIDIATGDYLQFVDSDDFLIPQNYNKVLALLRRKQMDMLMFRYTTSEKEALHPLPADVPDGVMTRTGCQHLKSNNLRAACCLYVFRREVLGNLRFQPGIFHEDTLFTPLLLMCTQTFADTEIKAYYYRQTEGSTMNSRNSSHIQRRLDNLLFVLQQFNAEADRLQGDEQVAMKRVRDQEVMCYIYHIIQLTHSLKQLRQRLKQLRQLRLFPLPLKPYTLKYWLFALTTRLIP